MRERVYLCKIKVDMASQITFMVWLFLEYYEKV
jgi:hypothetical protein